MADGTKYHRDSLTCAHRTYPFGTLLKVTNVSNGKVVIVKVCDRGPFKRGRIIDLSYKAAEQIGMINHGVVTVELEPVPENKIPLILDVNCGLKGIRFLKSYQYAVPVAKCPKTFHNNIKFHELPLAVPPKKRHRWFKVYYK